MNTSASLATAAPRALPRVRAASFSDHLELVKPGLSLLSVLTALAGYAVAKPDFGPGRFAALTIGTAAAAGGAAALNQFLEIDTDARMNRTKNRPLPAGRVADGSAFVLGIGLSFGGVALLLALVNGLAALFAGLTIATYLFLYTPAKRTSRWSTEIGAVAGAFPPLIGWTAGAGTLSTPGWILFGILLLWQIPHFMAIAWLYRHDYATVGFPMLAVRDPAGGKVAAWSLLNALLLVAVSLLPVATGFCTRLYGAAAAILGIGFVGLAVRFVRPVGRMQTARRLFFGSILYLPLLLGALVADRLFLH